MLPDLSKHPDYDAVFQALIEKTRQGRLHWEETADVDEFVCAVKGQQTFSIRWDNDSSHPVLAVSDAEGKLLFTTYDYHGSRAGELFRLVRRLATHLDERIDASVELLNQL